MSLQNQVINKHNNPKSLEAAGLNEQQGFYSYGKCIVFFYQCQNNWLFKTKNTNKGLNVVEGVIAILYVH